MKELFRLENLNMGSCLRNYNATVFESDIFCVQSPQEESLVALTKLLGGQAAPETGQFVYRGHRVEKPDEREALKRGVHVLSAADAYPENLTVTDYLDDIKPMFSPLSRRRERERTAQFLREEHVSLDPDAPLWRLDGNEHLKLRLLKAKRAGAKLVVLRIGGEAVADAAMEELMQMIRAMNRDGTTFFILSIFFSPFFALATRTQYVRDGRVLKEWDSIPPTALQRLRYGDNLSDVKRDGENAKLFFGIYDSGLDPRQDIWSYLEWIRAENLGLWGRMLAVDVPEAGSGYKNGVAVIPRDSQNLLLENLSIGENLSILAKTRVCYGGSSVVNRRLHRKLVESVCERYGFPKPSKPISALDEGQRKILSIARFEILRPSVMFLELPYQGIGPENVRRMRDCLYALAEKGIKIVYSAQSPEAMAGDCREIWHVHHGKVQNMTPFV
jgi:ABC-type sugar transport system ATPase subunit